MRSSTKTLRIFIVSALYPPHIGGVERFSCSLATELSSMGQQVTVITSELDTSPDGIDEKGAVEVIRLPSISLLGGRLPLPLPNRRYRRTLSMLRAREVDAVVVNTRFYPISLTGLGLAKHAGVRPLVIEHGSGHLTLGKRLPDAIIRAYEHGITGLVKRYRPKYYGVSRDAANWLNHFGIAADGVIHNSIDVSAFRSSASDRDFPRECGVPTDAATVAFTGRLIREKGIDELIETARLFHERGGKVHFLVAGEGPERERVEATASPNVHFLGSISSADVAALLMKADFFFLPSYSEGLPTSLLEAAACESCIVTTDVGGAREIIPSESCGTILAHPDPELAYESISNYINNPSLRETATKNCLMHVSTNLSWERAAYDCLAACDASK